VSNFFKPFKTGHRI